MMAFIAAAVTKELRTTSVTYDALPNTSVTCDSLPNASVTCDTLSHCAHDVKNAHNM